jgi:hypothetical protein
MEIGREGQGRFDRHFSAIFTAFFEADAGTRNLNRRPGFS